MPVFIIIAFIAILTGVISLMCDHLLTILMRDNPEVWESFDKPTSYSISFIWVFVIMKAHESEDVSEQVHQNCERILWMERFRLLAILLVLFV